MNILAPWLKEKKHVIWDWNGTLLDDIDHAVRTVNALLESEGLQSVTVDDYKKSFGFPVKDYYNKLGFNTERENFLRLCDRFNETFYRGLGECDLWPGARDLLAEIRGLGKTQSLLSASEHRMLLHSLEHFGVSHLFDHIFGIFDKTATSKVDRGHELIAQVGIDPSLTVLIGDTDHDLEVGQSLGIDVLLVEHGHQCPLRLRAKHPHVIKVL